MAKRPAPRATAVVAHATNGNLPGLINTILNRPEGKQLEAVATFIEGGPPSYPTLAILDAYLELTQWHIEFEKKAPSGAELENDLRALARDARSLLLRLANKENRNFLSVFMVMRAPAVRPDALIEHRLFLKEIAERGEQLAEIVAGEKYGRGKVYPDSANYNPREYCALLVISIWQAMHGVVPRAAAKAPRLAAEAYYLAAGGPRGTTIATTPRAWEKDFRRVLARQGDLARMTDEVIGAMNNYKLHQK